MKTSPRSCYFTVLGYPFKSRKLSSIVAKKGKTNPSEVHAYVYIIKELIEKKGWNKNQIYTQQECHKHAESDVLLGLKAEAS
jgi:hypothetical protein